MLIMVVTTYNGDIHGQEEQIVRRPKLVWFLSIFLMHESTFADPLYGVLQLTEGFYQLEPVILTHPGPLKNFTQLASSNRWVFELHTLEPAFDTERFQCVRSIEHDGCLS